MENKINSKGSFWLIIILILALGLVSLPLYQLVLANEIFGTRNCEGIVMQIIKTQLALIPTTDLVERKNVEEKIYVWETMIAICETVSPPTGISEITPQIVQVSTPIFTTGIFEGQTGDFHSFEAKIENHWKGIVDGNRVIVFAGAWVTDPQQGFITVKLIPSKGKAIWSYHPSATKSGALRIVDAQGSRLVIQQAADKNLLYFDLPTLTYVNSLDAIVVPGTPTENRSTEEPTTIPYPGP